MIMFMTSVLPGAIFRASIQRHRRCFMNNVADAIDNSVTIGDVTVEKPPQGSAPQLLVPDLPRLREIHLHGGGNGTIPPCHLSHLRWMMQKDLILRQDFALVGPPNLARDRRHLMLLYASLLGREVEWVSISRDTSEADLKQRKEFSNKGTMYVNQAPVRAALNGSLLVLEGLEKAERNVLPTLNNLLENRELPLDDGKILVSPEVHGLHELGVPVHPDFRVAALASMSIGESATLDPPLRSRFQARFVSSVDIGDMLVAASARSSGKMNSTTLKDIIKMAGEMPNGVSMESVHDAVRHIERFQQCIRPAASLAAHGINATGQMIGVGDITQELEFIKYVPKRENSLNFVETKSIKAVQDLIMASFECGNKAVALVGPKGCYKSVVARNLAHILDERCELMSLHPDITARDLLMTRGTCAESGDTIWRETPLARAAREGNWVILDGIDKLRPDTLTSIALLMDGFAIFPNGSRFQVSDNFRCIAIGLSPTEKKTWITPEVRGMFHWIGATPLPSHEVCQIFTTLFPKLETTLLDKLLALRKHLEDIVVDSVTEMESLQLNLRKLKHICRRVEQRPSELVSIVQSTLMMNFLPEWEKRIVEECIAKCSLSTPKNDYRIQSRNSLEDLLDSCKRTASNPLLVPNPRFEENPGQVKVMRDILEAHKVGEKALLICGYQGVGKNKIVDHLLKKLNCEREYLQLHRDTTVQSLMTSPSLESGRVIYHDSPLVRAAKEGRILVLDEADKAPVEVVALLKGLIEDGQLSLPDGRMLCYDDNITFDPDIISIHKDFAIWALVNPPGYPFHGHALTKEMSDVFSCHSVLPMEVESHKRILTSYGANVDPAIIEKVVNIWEDLRIAHQRGLLTYPFCVRESVNVIKHMNTFPDDGIEGAIDNVVSFDRLDRALSKQLDNIFGEHGIHIFSDSSTSTARKIPALLKGGVSTPKTRASSPKHGRVDPKNEPHVGGNTWAGGTGGSDTAGLGGRGGPYRLDLGHPVHQISDEMKAEVSEESKRRAKEMAAEALDKKLKELDMGKLDWKRYEYLRTQVEEQITQLKSYLKDLKKRSEEREWVRHQTTGELDENRIVDALAGERDVFKRRGNPNDMSNHLSNSDPVTIKLIIDISASMYRFNGYDQRLERLLEAALMMMECFREDKRFKFYMVGHNGSSANIPLVNPEMDLNEVIQLRVLECIVANTQYTSAGDNTVDAVSIAIEEASKGELIIIISDANLDRYGISVDDLAPLQSQNVHAHLIFIGSLGDEASKLASCIPNKRAQVCFESSQLPLVLKKIVTNALI